MQNNNEEVANLLYIRQEFDNNPFKAPWITDCDDGLRWLTDVTNYKRQFEDTEIEEKYVIKEVLKSIPYNNRQLYYDFCEHSDDDYDLNRHEYDNVQAWIVSIYPLPRSLEYVRRKIEGIRIRYKENPQKVFAKLQACFRRYDSYVEIINESEDNEDAHVDTLEPRDKLNICLDCFVQYNNTYSNNNQSFINNKIRTFIVKRDPLTYPLFEETITELNNEIRPYCENKNKN